MKKLLAVMTLAIATTACGPSEQEFVSSCLDRCMHEGFDCGLGVDPFYGNCDTLCNVEWGDHHDQSSDCLWFMTYWYDCRSDAPCDSLDSTCRSHAADVAAACDL